LKHIKLYWHHIYFLEKSAFQTALSLRDMWTRQVFFSCNPHERNENTSFQLWWHRCYRVSRNSTYFDIYPFTRPVSRTFNQPMIAMGSKQRNVFKKYSIARSIVRSPFEVIECRWPPRKFSKGVKISVVMCIRTDMSTIQNYSISRKVSSDTFISCSLKGLSYTARRRLAFRSEK